MPKIDVVVSATTKLLSPAAPGVLELLGTQTPDLEKLRVAIEFDPVLTMKAMHLANGGFYGRQVPIASLRRALVRMGWEASCEMLTRLLVEAAADSVDPSLGRPVWEHSLRVAVLTRLLAREARIVDPALAYTAGLVHAIGQLGLGGLYRDRYVQLWRQAPSGAHLAALERTQFGYDHTQVAAGVLNTLNLPEEIPKSIRRMYRAKLAERHWEGRRDLTIAAMLQLSQRLLYMDAKNLKTPGWLATQPLAQRLGLAGVVSFAASFQNALDGTQAEAAA